MVILYHLYLKPGLNLLEQIGGIHKFISWNGLILTDSEDIKSIVYPGEEKITEEGVKFKSHIDGSSHFFSPENVKNIQKSIGADIIMAFDECTPYPCDLFICKSLLLK